MSKHTVAPNEVSIKALTCPETMSRVNDHAEGLGNEGLKLVWNGLEQRPDTPAPA